MPVIINDFEIITESPRQEPAAAAPPAADEQPPALRPEDIARIMARQTSRTERVRAD
jgi:hypothetical protein